MKGFSRLKNKKGIALESAIIFMVSIFTFCFLLSSLTLLGHSQAKINNIYIENNLECDQLGEQFISYVNAVNIPYSAKCPTPIITIDNVNKKITITCSWSEASIYYTTDGNDPTTASTLYKEPITIEATCTIKAIAVYNANNQSDVAEQKVTLSFTDDSNDQSEVLQNSGGIMLLSETEDTQTDTGITEANATDSLYNYFSTYYSSYNPRSVATGFTIQHGGRVYTVIENRIGYANAISFGFTVLSGETKVMEISCSKSVSHNNVYTVNMLEWKKY